MKLSKLIKRLNCTKFVNYKNINITNLSMIDTKCTKGSMFFAIPGYKVNGADYAHSAVMHGAVCVVTSHIIENIDVVQLVVDDVRIALSVIAQNFYGRDYLRLKIISVVGSNGKTTTANIVYNMLRFCGKKVGLIGTLGVKINDVHIPTDFTTPDPIELNYMFHQMVNFGCEYCVMEVSAHAIALNKMYGIVSECAIFTNISNEHLDFFGNMNNYAMTKLKYFDVAYTRCAIVNVDDAYGRMIISQSGLPCYTYGLYNPSDTFAINVKYNLEKCNFVVNAFDKVASVSTCFVGEYNVYNILASLTCVCVLDLNFNMCIMALKSMKAIPGRMEVFKFTKDNIVVVDFAHTPDGFEKVLSLISSTRQNGRIITLFGSVSYADSAKRKSMGKIARKYSDYIILTSDNPDDMDFETICADIGLKGKNVIHIKDRKQAIEYGVGMFDKHDTLVCLGKGGETKQKINGINVPYNELEVVKSIRQGYTQ